MIWPQCDPRKQIRGYAGGTFDLFHPGHVQFFEQCRSQCDHLTVSLNTDDFATRYKRKPIMNLTERRIMVASCRYVDRVIINTGDEDSRPSILKSGADLVFHGDDWTGESLMEQMGFFPEWLEVHGIDLRYVPYSPITSTSEIIKRAHDFYLSCH